MMGWAVEYSKRGGGCAVEHSFAKRWCWLGIDLIKGVEDRPKAGRDAIQSSSRGSTWCLPKEKAMAHAPIHPWELLAWFLYDLFEALFVWVNITRSFADPDRFQVSDDGS